MIAATDLGLEVEVAAVASELSDGRPVALLLVVDVTSRGQAARLQERLSCQFELLARVSTRSGPHSISPRRWTAWPGAVVPALADWAAVWIVDEAGRAAPTALKHGDPTLGPAVEQARIRIADASPVALRPSEEPVLVPQPFPPGSPGHSHRPSPHPPSCTPMGRWTSSVPASSTAGPTCCFDFEHTMPRCEFHIELPWGTTVFMYSDGLIERRGCPLDDGLAQLTALLEANSRSPLDEMCDAVLAGMPPGRLEDDVATIAIRTHRQDRPRPAEAGPRVVPPNVPPSRD